MDRASNGYHSRDPVMGPSGSWEGMEWGGGRWLEPTPLPFPRDSAKGLSLIDRLRPLAIPPSLSHWVWYGREMGLRAK